MSKPVQNYSNHRRLHPPYHFVLVPFTTALLVWAIIRLFPDFNATYLFIALLSFGLVGLLLLTRLYALKNQNRIIRLEMRFRYHLLTGKRLESLEPELGMGQIIALRFASDAELPDLIEKAIREKMKPDDIKKQITNWQGDHNRV